MCMMVKGIEAPLNIIQGSPGRALPPRDVAAYGSTEDQRLQCFLASYQLPAFASCTDNFNGHLAEVVVSMIRAARKGELVRCQEWVISSTARQGASSGHWSLIPSTVKHGAILALLEEGQWVISSTARQGASSGRLRLIQSAVEHGQV